MPKLLKYRAAYTECILDTEYASLASNSSVSLIGFPLLMNCRPLPDINTFDWGECSLTASKTFNEPVQMVWWFSKIAVWLVVELAARWKI